MTYENSQELRSGVARSFPMCATWDGAEAESESVFSVVTWNVHLLSVTAGSQIQLIRRAACIATKIKQHGADVVCLQVLTVAA